MIITIFISGIFFILDQISKYIARTYPDATFYLVKPWIGWEYFKNDGIAFGIPIPQIFLLLVTPIILIFFIHSLKKRKKSIHCLYGMGAVVAGAISNFIDRLLFHTTIDYIRVGTSILNIADIMIVLGAGLLIICELKNTKTKK
ncbi:MAG: signal peptidase II [Candidatus Magasanikbacteria bacterium]|nr:signal peptidase II [Candidatus Magasanikbacteria bacterium]MBT4071450.1 signal peptidase II [Candidatus Magasanikbacteria bacterium]